MIICFYCGENHLASTCNIYVQHQTITNVEYRQLLDLNGIVSSYEDDLDFFSSCMSKSLSRITDAFGELSNIFRYRYIEMMWEMERLNNICYANVYRRTNEADELFNMAMTTFGYGDIEKSLRLLQDATILNPIDYRIYIVMGHIYVRNDDLKNAVDRFELGLKYAKLNYHKSYCLLLISRIHYCWKDIKTAIDKSRLAVELSPNYIEVRYQYAAYRAKNIKAEDLKFENIGDGIFENWVKDLFGVDTQRLDNIDTTNGSTEEVNVNVSTRKYADMSIETPKVINVPEITDQDKGPKLETNIQIICPDFGIREIIDIKILQREFGKSKIIFRDVHFYLGKKYQELADRLFFAYRLFFFYNRDEKLVQLNLDDDVTTYQKYETFYIYENIPESAICTEFVKNIVHQENLGIPEIQVNNYHFQFSTYCGVNTKDSFAISNTGGGKLNGTIQTNRKWLNVSKDNFNITKSEDIVLNIDTLYPSGFMDKGIIEIKSNGGTMNIYVDISIISKSNYLKN